MNVARRRISVSTKRSSRHVPIENNLLIFNRPAIEVARVLGPFLSESRLVSIGQSRLDSWIAIKTGRTCRSGRAKRAERAERGLLHNCPPWFRRMRGLQAIVARNSLNSLVTRVSLSSSLANAEPSVELKESDQTALSSFFPPSSARLFSPSSHSRRPRDHNVQIIGIALLAIKRVIHGLGGHTDRINRRRRNSTRSTPISSSCRRCRFFFRRG